MQQALGGGAAEQQPESGSGGAAAVPAASSSELCECAAKLVAALEQAAGPTGHAAVGAAVAQPLVALLLPEVRSGSAPPAASSLLAALLKSFPQHAAADAARPESPSAAAAAAAAAAAPSGEMAALRLHQSASFTIESLVRCARLALVTREFERIICWLVGCCWTCSLNPAAVRASLRH